MAFNNYTRSQKEILLNSFSKKRSDVSAQSQACPHKSLNTYSEQKNNITDR